MGKAIAFFNCKGGVSTTTTVFHLAVRYASEGYKTLLIDLNPNGGLTNCFLLPNQSKSTIFELFHKDIPASELLVNVNENLDLVPACEDLYSLDLDIKPNEIFYNLFKSKFQSLFSNYAFILFDVPPVVNFLSLCGMYCSDSFFVPHILDSLGTKNLYILYNIINYFEQNFNIKFENIIPCKVDQQHHDFEHFTTQLEHLFEGKISDSIIRYDRNCEPEYSLLDFRTQIAKDYKALAEEIIQVEYHKQVIMKTTA